MIQTDNKQRIIKWLNLLIPACITSILFLVIYQKSSAVFFINDDENILYTLAGYYTNGVRGDHSFVNYCLGFIISSLYQLFPSVAWYGAFHVAVLFASIFVIGLCIFNISSKYDINILFPTMLFGCLTLLCGLYPVTLMQFTTTSAIAGTAAVALLLYAELGNHHKISTYAASIIFLLLCYCHRKNTGNVILCFYLLVTVYGCIRCLRKHWIENKSARFLIHSRSLICFILSMACICSVIFISQKLVRSTDSWDSFYEFDEARFKAIDYPHDSYDNNPELYQKLGWSKSLSRLTLGGFWFFMDERVNAESFDAIAETGYKNTQSSFQDIINNFIKLQHEELLARTLFAVIIVLLVAVTVIAATDLKKNWLELLLACCAVGGSCLMILYLCWKGRFIMRAFQVIAYPSIVIEAIALIAVIAHSRWKKTVMSVCLVFGIVGCLFSAIIGYDIFNQTRVAVQMRQIKSDRTHMVEEYAIAHPDNVYIYDTSLTFRYSPFVTYPDDKPSNLFFWGGMGWHSPTFYDQLHQNGLEELYSDVFFKDNVYYISYSGYTLGNATTVKDLFQTYMDDTYGPVVIESVEEITPEIIIYKISQ